VRERHPEQEPPVRRSRLALVLPALLLALSGCGDGNAQANDDGPEEQPQRPPSVLREPAAVQDAPLTVDPPGPTRSP
jgi:hypothetical protein